MQDANYGLEVRLLSFMVVVASLLGVPAQAVTLFDTESDFVSTSDQIVTENFETSAVFGTESSGGVLSANFGILGVTADRPAIKLLAIPSIVGNHNTTPGGSNYLAIDTDVGNTSANVVLEFSTPVLAVGFYAVDIEDGLDIEIGGQHYFIPPTPSGGEQFFGIRADSPFSQLSLAPGSQDSFWNIDDISYLPVPEPSGFLLLGLACLTLLRRHRIGAEQTVE